MKSLKPSFVSVEYQTRDPENLTILRTCRCRWVRNKDIAKATKMTPAGAKRRNEFLQSVGLLERRRCGREVQFCTTLLAYLANLRLGEEEPLAAMGVMRNYLDLTKEYSLRILKDLASTLPGDGDVDVEYQRYREFQAVLTYLWPTDTLSKLWIDLGGFDRPGAVIYEVNQMTIPMPVLTPKQYESLASGLQDVSRKLGENGEGQEIWEYLSKELLTGRKGIADYNQHKTKIIDELADSKQKAGQHYAVMRRLRQWFDEFQDVGPGLVIVKGILDDILRELGDLGLEEVDIPQDIPIGLPNFEMLPPFNEQTYSQIKKGYGLT